MKKYCKLLKSLLAATVSMLLVLALLPAVAFAEGSAVITSESNPALYSALVERYGFPDIDSITQEQLDSLTELRLNGVPGLTNIDGLEHCSNVYCLSLQDDNDLQRLPADMSGMTSLELIQLDGIYNLRDVGNLHAIATPPMIWNISISGSNVTDVSFLNPSAAPSLRSLQLSGIETMTVSDLAKVAVLTQLDDLNLNCNGAMFENPAAALSIAVGMSNLKSLCLSYSELNDIAPLVGATNLQWLDLTGNYLDPRPESGDMAVVASLEQAGCTVVDDEQQQFTVQYSSPAGTPSKTTDLVYYQQDITLPTVADVPAGAELLGWDTNNDGVADRAAGETMPFTIPAGRNFFIEFMYSAVFSGLPTQTDGSCLLDLGASVGSLNKPFDPLVTSGYVLTLPEGTSKVTFAPVKSDPKAKLYINGKRSNAFTVSLKNGQTKNVTIKVVAQNRASKTYTVQVTREKSTNANLKALSVSNCTTALDFTPGTQNYAMTVKQAKTSVTVTSVKADKTATVYIDGCKASSKTISIPSGASRTVTVKVVPLAGEAYAKYYTITLTRPAHTGPLPN